MKFEQPPQKKENPYEKLENLSLDEFQKEVENINSDMLSGAIAKLSFDLEDVKEDMKKSSKIVKLSQEVLDGTKPVEVERINGRTLYELSALNAVLTRKLEILKDKQNKSAEEFKQSGYEAAK